MKEAKFEFKQEAKSRKDELSYLSHGEEEGEVAVDVVLGLELPGGLDALPGRAELDEHALLGDALLGVELDQPLGLGNLETDKKIE